jgi:hypothetical protein
MAGEYIVSGGRSDDAPTAVLPRGVRLAEMDSEAVASVIRITGGNF